MLLPYNVESRYTDTEQSFNDCQCAVAIRCFNPSLGKGLFV